MSLFAVTSSQLNYLAYVFGLACGICPASGEIAIDARFLEYFEGAEAMLLLSGFPPSATEVSWYRDTKVSEPNLILSHLPPSNIWHKGPRFSGRENITEGSLLFSWVKIHDTGNYTVKVTSPNGDQTATALLRVGEYFTTPVLTVNTSSAVELLDVVGASCNTNATKIEWHLSDRPVVSNDRMTLSPDNRTLVIHRISRSDTWLDCVASNSLDMTKKGFASLSVACEYSEAVEVKAEKTWGLEHSGGQNGPDSLSFLSQPYNYEGVVTADIGSLVNIECMSYSVPAPTYRWTHYNTPLNVSGQKVTIRNLTEKQLGRYRCTVQNSRTQITIYKDVWINKPRYVPDTKVLHLGKPVVVVLIMLAVLGGLSLCGMLIFILIGQCSNRASAQIHDIAHAPIHASVDCAYADHQPHYEG
ncbi:carcinoembryonic antigen-related cell adhesion molecule 18 [Suncus etruscus]|uniref:carcinoembryonic antigen-related cell adhesion molecule 18 n=1 Tax=Suncus etruscus TaxID=109475 RepID=UPI00210F4120|nr:carcinoembryonic antigen-related cell adhesion molecule 18 [Suncus etruscus]